MATRMLLKAKPDPKLSLQILRNPISVLTRPVSAIAQPESTSEAPRLSFNRASTSPMILAVSQKPFACVVGNGGFSLASGAVFARHMGTGRSSSRPRGGSSRDDEDDGDFDEDDGGVDGVDDFDEDVEDDDDDLDMDDIDEGEGEEEEENPKRKKAGRRY